MASVFPTEIDSFKTHREPTAADSVKIRRYEVLRQKDNKTSAEVAEYNNLVSALAEFIFTPEDLNTIQDAMVNLETYFKNTVDGDLNEWEANISNRIDKFSFKGLFSPSDTYVRDNVTRYANALYVCVVDSTTGQNPQTSNDWQLMMPNQKGDKGEKGDAGANMVVRGLWSTNTAYVIDDLVNYNNELYVCTNAHTSSTTFNAAYWRMLVSVNSYEYDLEALAMRLNAVYHGSLNNNVYTETITSGSDTLLICTTDLSNENSVVMTFNNSRGLLGNETTITITTTFNDNEVTTTKG